MTTDKKLPGWGQQVQAQRGREGFAIRQELARRREELQSEQPWDDHPDGMEGWLYEAVQTPWDYGRKVLGVDIYPKQEEIMRALLRYPRVAVAGCNSSGKTFTMAPYSLWKLTVSEQMGILQIAPTREQSRGVFWRDMRGLYRGSRMAQNLLGGPEMRQTGLEVTDYRYAHAVSPGDEMSVRGYHAMELLFILDEGNGVNATFFDAIRGITASGEINVAQLGNPTENSGVFYDSFNEPELGWHTMNISAFDSPNLVSLEVPDWFDEVSEAPGAISDADRRKLAYLRHLRQQWLAKRDRLPASEIPELAELMDDVTLHLTRRLYVADGEADWARAGHPSWYGRILGVFPPESEYQLINRSWLDNAKKQSSWQDKTGMMVWGVDPSGMGQSEFVVAGLQIDAETMEHRLAYIEGFQGSRSFEEALAVMQPYMNETAWINVDRMGAGERPSIEIKRWAEQWGVPVYGFVSQQASTNPQFFRDIKAQAYYYLRDMLEVGYISNLTDPLAQRQLLSLQYEITNRGQVAMESKQNMRKRGVASPDRADALAYACFPLANLCPWSMILGA